jgi:hypothetical protein
MNKILLNMSNFISRDKVTSYAYTKKEASCL